MEIITVLLFCTGLVLCLALNISVVWALTFGIFVFCGYAKYKKFTYKEIAQMLLKGISTVKRILFVFILIGILTAVWRCAGTIPVIISYSVRLIKPSVFMAACFLLCCALSFLTGTSVGSAATMGVICMSISNTMGINAVLTGGAILSGVYFGDRCSPVSTSALLVSQVSDTSIYDNIKNMFKTAAVPFLFTCVIYFIIGLKTNSTADTVDTAALFGQEFNLNLVAVVPALVIIVLAMFRIKVAYAMEASIATALILTLIFQKYSASEILRYMLTGFKAESAEVGALINGGGILSIRKMFFSVLIASSYTDVFEKTGLLNKLKDKIGALSRNTTRYFAVLCVSVLSSAIACSQSFAIMLTEQLCNGLYEKKNEIAIDLEDSAVLVAALIPWSVACAAVISSSGAPDNSYLTAIYLFAIPLWRIICSFAEKLKSKQ